MKGQVIGKTMPHGYAGSYSRQADMIVDTHPCEAGIAFGAPVVLGSMGSCFYCSKVCWCGSP